MTFNQIDGFQRKHICDYVRFAHCNTSEIVSFNRRLLHAMYQSKVEEAVQQAKALQKAMASGKMAQTVRRLFPHFTVS